MNNSDYDIAFLGFGVSAISHLIIHQRELVNHSIVVLDRAPAFDMAKTLSGFFSEHNGVPSQRASRHWLAGGAERLKAFHSESAYEIFEPQSLWQHFEAILPKFRRLELFFNTQVHQLLHAQSNFQIRSSRGDLNAEFVFDSRFCLQHLEPLKNRYLKQYFFGVELEFQGGAVELPSVLMEIDGHFQQGLKFLYRLNLGDGRYLFELTFFAKHVLENQSLKKQLQHYLDARFSHYRILREESGVLPLVEVRPDFKAKNYFALGVRAGHLRASTGYSFARSLLQSKNCFSAKPRFSEKVFWRGVQWMDRVFLEVLYQHPERSAELFERIFDRLSANQISGFLGPRPPIMVLIAIVTKMPKLLFLKAAVRLLFQRRHLLILREIEQ